MSFTDAEYQQLLRNGPKAKTSSKYRAVKTVVGGLTFDSKREAQRYHELKLSEKAGTIRALRCHVRYALCPLILEHADCRDINAGTPSARRLPVAQYVGDFEYEESYLGQVWNLVVEDVKGTRTTAYLLKKRWFEAQYGLRIRETR